MIEPTFNNKDNQYMNYFLLFRKDGEDIRVKTYLVDVPKLVAVMYEAGYTLEDIKDQPTQV